MEVIEVNRSEDKVSPNATLIIKKYYRGCGHTTKDYATIPEEIVNKTQNEVKEIYKNWTLYGFSTEEIVLYKELDGICKEHYMLRALDGVIAIYIMDEQGKESLQEKTGIYIEYLPESDVKKLEQGIQAIGKEALNSVLEDYE